MSLLTKQAPTDPQDVTLNYLVAQEQVDVNFISRNNFNNNAYRSNFGCNNPRTFPSNNYGNSNSNSYSQNYRERDLPSYEKLVEIEKGTKSYMHTQFEQNKAFSRQLDEHSSILQNISKQLESLNSDISSLQTRLTGIETHVSNMSHTQSTLINQMAAKPEVIPKEEERIKSLPTYHTVATIQVVEDDQIVSTHHTPRPTGPINGDATTSTIDEETSMNIEAFKQVILNDITTSLIDGSHLDFDNCTLPEVIGFIHKMSRDPHTSTLNLAFTEHITNALIKVREEKLRVEASIPINLEDGWDPMIRIKLNNFSCFALCDVGDSTSVMPKGMYDMLELKPFDPCTFGVRLVDSSVKKPLGKIDNVLIIVNDNYVPVDFTIMDIECEPSCPIILGRPFLRTVGVTIDMKEGTIKFQFPLKKGMKHFPRKKIKLPFESVTRASYSLEKTLSSALSLAN